MIDGIVKAVLNHFEDTIRLDVVAVVRPVGVWIKSKTDDAMHVRPVHRMDRKVRIRALE
ncbi:hypothetical protein KB1_00440 [Cutibacterium modestum]|uniref:Uncharacterized protein n=1 Tax=Cutibacterium modestum TaxID=2559073 RepID=A0AAD1NUX1_9ACTN|nr:hypothetical protein KB1_00440 [Cutibacterium modestum]